MTKEELIDLIINGLTTSSKYNKVKLTCKDLTFVENRTYPKCETIGVLEKQMRTVCWCKDCARQVDTFKDEDCLLYHRTAQVEVRDNYG